MIDASQKLMLRVLIRRAIKDLNKQFMFSCMNCSCCVPRDDDIPGYKCMADVLPFPSTKRQSAHLMPDCFSYSYVDSPLAEVLIAMANMGIDFHAAERGWPTIVSRMLPRLSKFGHNMSIKPMNLERWQ